jgi:hypothetical protein
MRLDEPVTLQSSKQRIDRALADDEEAALAQPLRHLVAVGGLLLDDGKEAKVENAS